MKLIDARKMLVNYLKSNFTPQNNGRHKQDDWRFIVGHCFRVEKYVVQIANSFDLIPEDIRLIRLAAILHDIGYSKNWKEHAKAGKEILKNILIDEPNKDIILELVANHSDKKEHKNENILLSILKDADGLDEMGAMSILMFAKKNNYDKPDFFRNLLSDLTQKDIIFCKEQKSILRTEKAKEICQQKINFIENFIEQLNYETSNSFDMMNEIITL